jgi:hypothetical protein
MSDGAARARAGNLTAALVAVALLELALNRLAGKLFLPRPSISGADGGSLLVRALADSGTFLSHLTGVLALGILPVAFVGLLLRRELFPRPMRVAVVVIALVFWALAARAVVLGDLPPQLFVMLEISFAFLLLLVAAAALGGSTGWRAKLGVLLFALPGTLHVLTMVAERTNMLGSAPPTIELARLAEMALLVACLAAPALLPPRPVRERPWVAPLVVALPLTVLFAALMAVRYDLVQATALHALRIEVPRLDSLLGIVYLVAFFCWIYVTVQLLVDKGGMRLAGYGLLLLAAGGYQISSPVELALSLLGLVALAVGEQRAAPYGDASQRRIGTTEWRGFVGRLATATADGSAPEDTPPEAVVVEDGEAEVSRIRAHRRGRPVLMRLRRRRGVLVELEAIVGQPGHGAPDASIERHRRWLGRSLSERIPHARIRTGDPAFDQRFTVSGQAPLADAALRQRLARQQGDGTVSLWRGAGARYLIADPSPSEAPPPFAAGVQGDGPVAAVVAMLDTLVELIESSGD